MGLYGGFGWNLVDNDYYQRNQRAYANGEPGSGASTVPNAEQSLTDDPTQAGYRSRLETILNGGLPTRQANRFEPGLSQAEQRLTALFDNPDAIKQSAAYKFRVGQGEEALQRQMAAKGMLGSGNRLMELTKYGQDMASQEYDNQAKRLQDLFGTYTTGYLGGEQAASQRYGVEADAMAKRGGLLRDLIADQGKMRLGWAELWNKQNGGGGGGGMTRTIGQSLPMQQSPLSTIW